ncbi:hypothetical protein GWR55_02570 [Edaphobacter sp. 12200R-103]|nr:hypothetical protein GWR55_02570 [Edaphobacter sp. 12200R-103]
MRWANVGSASFALLQSICAAVLAISGLRVFIGVSALVMAGILPPLEKFHQDAIRIPMMILALAGAVANLYSVWRVRSLRARPAAQWRARPVSPNKIRAERTQIALAVITLVLLVVEGTLHLKLHGHL